MCTVLFGIDQKSGVAFLAHFDLFWSPKILPALIDEAKEKAGKNAHFEVQVISGSWLFSLLINPWVTRVYLRSLIRRNADMTLTKDHWFARFKLRRVVEYSCEKKDITVTEQWCSGGKEDEAQWMSRPPGSA